MWKIALWIGVLAVCNSAEAQMNTAGMENSVGFLSSGTSIEPKTTGETDAMVHSSLGNWTLMFHANAFLVDTQQTGPRGADKLYSVNWLMPMFSRQVFVPCEDRWPSDPQPSSF